MTPREISERLAGYAEDICRQLLPQGKRVGTDWCVGSIRGEPGESLKVKLTGSKSGLWADFASSEKGDLIGLYEQTKNVTLREAIQWGKRYLGVSDESDSFHAKPRPKTVAASPTTTRSKEITEWFENRGISPATLDAYNVLGNGTVIEFQYIRDGQTYMIKWRDFSKAKKSDGIRTTKGSTWILFGWPAVPENAREVVITEGEPDALAYYEQGIPALSIPYGAGSGEKMKWIENDYDALERFDTIYLSMDMDSDGQGCIEEYVKRLGFYRVRVVSLPFKDANETHLQGDHLDKYIAEARYLDPKELRAASSFESEVIEQFYPKNDRVTGIALPWQKVGEKFRLRPSEVTGWMGINGHGKTKLLSHITAYGIAQGEKWCLASMEMKPAVLLKTLYQQSCGLENPSEDVIRQTTRFVDERCWIVNITGTAKADRLLELFRYAWKRYGINHVVIDSLSKCGMAEDDYNAQKDFIDRCGDLAKETGMHIHIVMHSRKHENEDKAPNKMDAKGTGAITDMVDNVVSIWRNKPKQDKISTAICKGEEPEQKYLDKPDAIVQVHKQRHFDWEGKLLLWFNPGTHQFLQKANDMPYDYVSEVAQ